MHNDLSLHCTDFFLERRNRSYYLHCLEEVDLQMRSRWGRGGGGEPLANHHHHDLIETSFGGHDLQTMEIIRSVSSFEKNPYNVSSNLSLSRAHFMFICFGRSWRSWRSWRSFKCTDYAYITYIKSGKSHHFVNGSIAHLQSINLRSERGGFESRHRRCKFESLHRRWCLFLGSMHKNANSFFINWGLWITLSPEQRLGVKRHKLEIVEDLDNDFPVQYGTELYRKIIIQVPLEV